MAETDARHRVGDGERRGPPVRDRPQEVTERYPRPAARGPVAGGVGGGPGNGVLMIEVGTGGPPDNGHCVEREAGHVAHSRAAAAGTPTRSARPDSTMVTA